MTIKQQGGIFGRNPTFNDLTVDGSVTVPANSISGNAVDGGTAGVDNLIADDVITAGGTTVTHGANSDGTIRVEGSSAPAFAINDTGQSKEYFLTALGDFVQMRYADAGDTGGFSNSTELLTMKATGDVTVNTGNLVIGTSGKGIDFSATADASGSTSELFDDYEEGTFTPVLSDSSGNDATAGFSNGVYTKIGRTVVAEFYLLNINTSGLTAGDNIRISLPFTHIAAQRGTAAVYFSKVTFSTLPVGVVNPGQAFLELFEASSGADGGYVPVSTLASGTADVFATVTFNT